MTLWEAKLKDTEMFKSYQANARLFSSPGKTQEWNLNTVSKALNMLLGAIGLSLSSQTKRKQVRGKKTSTTAYKLDAGDVGRMLELVRLRMRGSKHRGSTPNAHARELLLQETFPLYGHLVDAAPPEPVYAFIE